MQKTKTTVIDLDSARERDETIFLCLHEDCFTSFATETPRRKNLCNNVVCPKCGRNHFMYWLYAASQHIVHVHFGKKRKKRV